MNASGYFFRKQLQAPPKRLPHQSGDNTIKHTALFLAAFAALSAAPLLVAQTPAPVTPAPRPTIHQRKENQQGRIAQGVKTGQLTAGETGRLEHQQAGINHEERGMKAQDNGKLTGQDRRTLRAQQNQESRRIARDKHNVAKQ